MRPDDFAKLLEDTHTEILAAGGRVEILGLTPVTLDLVKHLMQSGALSTVRAIHAAKGPGDLKLAVPVKSVESLLSEQYDVLTVASDEDKETLLVEALPYIKGTPKVIVAGYGPLDFRDPVFIEERQQLLVPSIANGYPNSLVHIYQCLVNCARLGLQGSIAEFGMFKGGTTVFMARIVRRLGQDWPIFGFDTFGGFPARRSPLDMYDHPDCIFTDVRAVERYTSEYRVRVVSGDIVATVQQLREHRFVLSFVDTDNYTSATAALDLVQERTVVGGAIVFDHFTGVDRFRYTLGERLAGKRLLGDGRYFHLHGTGVFYRQR
jgi:O-methyltransferase